MAGSAVLDVVEKILSSLVAVDGIPPADWSSILLVLYHKGKHRGRRSGEKGKHIYVLKQKG